jgi:hypothetical protein
LIKHRLARFFGYTVKIIRLGKGLNREEYFVRIEKIPESGKFYPLTDRIRITEGYPFLQDE